MPDFYTPIQFLETNDNIEPMHKQVVIELGGSLINPVRFFDEIEDEQGGSSTADRDRGTGTDEEREDNRDRSLPFVPKHWLPCKQISSKLFFLAQLKPGCLNHRLKTTTMSVLRCMIAGGLARRAQTLLDMMKIHWLQYCQQVSWVFGVQTRNQKLPAPLLSLGYIRNRNNDTSIMLKVSGYLFM